MCVYIYIYIYYCCSVTKLCPTLCDPMVCSLPGFPVLHYLPEFTQIHVHWVGDAICRILCHPLLFLPSIFPCIRSFPVSQIFSSGGQSIGVSTSASVLPMNIQDWFPLGQTGLISLQSKRLLRISSSATIWKHWLFSTQPSLWSNSHIRAWLLEKPQLWLYQPLSAKWRLCFFNTLSLLQLSFQGASIF